MKSFINFINKFGKRLFVISGADFVINSKPVKVVTQSPIAPWTLPMSIVGIMLLGIFINLSAFEKAKIGVQTNRNDYSSHLMLARVAAVAKDYDLAESEFFLAQKLIKQSASKQILGSESNIDEIYEIVFPVQTIEEEVKQLEKIVMKKSNYRDILLRLTILNWQLYKTDEALDYYKQAYYLDPNNEKVVEVGKIIF